MKETGLYAIERKRLRGDMIEMFKVLKGIDKISAEELFSRVDTVIAPGALLESKEESS